MSQLLDLIQSRRSDRHFSQQSVSNQDIKDLLEAFRWAPSCNNRQPWRVVLARSASAQEAFDAALSEGNRPWAPAASLKMIILGVPEEQPEKNGQQSYLLDVGFAMQNMMLQGYAMGLTIHAMAGFDTNKIRDAFDIPASAQPVALMVAGYRGVVEQLPEAVRVKDLKPRTRKNLEEFSFANRYGEKDGF
jgi:nitroreductase